MTDDGGHAPAYRLEDRPGQQTARACGIGIHLDRLLEERGLSQVDLAERVGIHPVNLSRLKNGHVTALKFETLAALCRELECQPGDLLTCG